MAFNIENISVKPLNTVNSVIKENVLVKSSLLKFNLSKKRNYSILQGNSILKSHLNYNENILNKKDALIYNKVNPLYINNYNWKRYITSKVSKIDKRKRELLPTNVRPTHYSIFLFPDLEKFTFEGNVDIDLNVNKDSTVITANAFDMTIHSASLIDVATMEKQDAKNIELDSTAQTLKLTFAKTIKKGSKVKLSIKFTGNLNNEMDGFYRSEYTDSNGKKKIYGSYSI